MQKILRDNVDKYVSENVFKNLVFYPNRFVLTSERDGYNHLYLYDLNGSLIKKAVGGQLIVKSFYGYDTADGSFYFPPTRQTTRCTQPFTGATARAK